MNLGPDETDLVGNWIQGSDGVVSDSVEKRINQLIADHLRKVAVSPESGGWEVLYRDPLDGRYWELTFPHSEMHGGGPRRLTCIPLDQMNAKYRLST
jgi:hypothetical protein